MKKYITKKNIFYLFIIITFIVLSIIITTKHEQWSDEINAWLLSDSLSIPELFKYLNNEGHPILFFLIIKIFSALGFSFSSFRYLSIFFSTIGIILLLYKTDYKWYIKLLLPFTYFIFYQYNIITRGYCLILPLLILIASLYEKRKEKCIPYTILLILLISLEIHTLLIAGSLYFILILDYIKDYKNKKLLICNIILFISFLLTTIYLFPRTKSVIPFSSKMYQLSYSFIYTPFDNKIISIILTFVIIFILGLIFIKTNKKVMLENILIVIPLTLFCSMVYINYWHYGIFFILFIFIFQINKLYNNKYVNILLLITCIIQIYWSINTSIYDYKNSYSPNNKEIADFIKQYDYKNLKIFCYDFHDTNILIYFDSNIFDNLDQEYKFFNRKEDSKYNTIRTIIKEKIEEEQNIPQYKIFNPDIIKYIVSKQEYDIIVFTPITYETFDTEYIKEYYNEYSFSGSSYFETNIYEDLTCYVYIRKDLDTLI